MPRSLLLDRRRLLAGSAAFGGAGLLGLGSCATTLARAQSVPGAALALADPIAPVVPIRASLSRVFDTTVCLRPFRAAGPRLDTETIGDAQVVHNYGHGGSGWSLSWGSSAVAVGKAMANSPREVAVLGCGALGLTSAILAQQAGAQVTIYARDLTPQTRSARATGSWTPDSRIALEGAAGPAFGNLWEQMARYSFKTYRRYLGLPGNPVEFTDRYYLSDQPLDAPSPPDPPGALDFAYYANRIRDIQPRYEQLPDGSAPFPTAHVSHASQMMFNIADYAHTLLTDFFAAGGKFQRMDFHSPSELGALKEKVVINCPGYEARKLWRDESIIPFRGQISWLIPQPEANYGVIYRGVNVLSRRDGIVVQDNRGGDMQGYKDENETPDRAETESAVAVIAELTARMRAMRPA